MFRVLNAYHIQMLVWVAACHALCCGIRVDDYLIRKRRHSCACPFRENFLRERDEALGNMSIFKGIHGRLRVRTSCPGRRLRVGHSKSRAISREEVDDFQGLGSPLPVCCVHVGSQ